MVGEIQGRYLGYLVFDVRGNNHGGGEEWKPWRRRQSPYSALPTDGSRHDYSVPIESWHLLVVRTSTLMPLILAHLPIMY